MKNEREKITFFWLSFCHLFSAWKIVEGRRIIGLLHVIVMPTIFQSLIFYHFYPFICCLSVILWLDKGDFTENLHTVCPCQNKPAFVWTFFCLALVRVQPCCGLWHIGYFGHTCHSCLWCHWHRLQGTTWQHTWSCLHNFQTLIFNKQDKQLTK